MAINSKTMTKRRFDTPDQHRAFPLGSSDVVAIGGMTVSLATFEPGWKWSKSLKPIVGTESCEVHHVGYLLSGRLYTKMNDGSEMEFVPGDLLSIPPGHDGWTVGDEPVLLLQIEAATPQG